MNVNTELERILLWQELIGVLTEVQNLDPENKTANVRIYNKYILITRPDQEDGYFIEL